MGRVARYILFHSTYIAVFSMILLLHFFQIGGLEIKAIAIIATYVIVWMGLNLLTKKRAKSD